MRRRTAWRRSGREVRTDAWGYLAGVRCVEPGPLAAALFQRRARPCRHAAVTRSLVLEVSRPKRYFLDSSFALRRPRSVLPHLHDSTHDARRLVWAQAAF